MKKYSILALALVLAATMLAGCRNQGTSETTMPSTEMTMPTILPTNVPETTAPTMPTVPATTDPSGSMDETVGTENGDTTNGGTTNDDSGSNAGGSRNRIR